MKNWRKGIQGEKWNKWKKGGNDETKNEGLEKRHTGREMRQSGGREWRNTGEGIISTYGKHSATTQAVGLTIRGSLFRVVSGG